jgi:hypothetical protein
LETHHPVTSKKYKLIDYISSLVRSLNCWFVSTG